MVFKNKHDYFPNTDEPSHKKWHCLGFFVVLLVIYQICCFTNGWMVNGDEYMGMWQLCSEKIGCLWMETSPSFDVLFLDWFAAVRAMLILTSIFTLLAIMFQIFNIYYGLTISMFPVRSCAILNASFLTIAIIVFPLMKPSTFDNIWLLGWTYYVTCAACLLSFIQIFVTFKVGNIPRQKNNYVDDAQQAYGMSAMSTMQGPNQLRSRDPTSAEEGAFGRDDWTITSDKNYPIKHEEASPLPEKKNISSSSSSSARSSRSGSVSSQGSASSGKSSRSGTSSYTSASKSETESDY